MDHPVIAGGALTLHLAVEVSLEIVQIVRAQLIRGPVEAAVWNSCKLPAKNEELKPGTDKVAPLKQIHEVLPRIVVAFEAHASRDTR